jgi:hypothetical protein
VPGSHESPNTTTGNQHIKQVALDLLLSYPEVLRKYQRRFRHILVDEFQVRFFFFFLLKLSSVSFFSLSSMCVCIHRSLPPNYHHNKK